MATVKSAYGTNGQVVSISLASLADSATTARQSLEIDNSSDLFIEVLVTVKIKTGVSVAGDKAIYVYVFGTVDGGTTRTENAGNADVTLTLTDPSNARLIGVLNTPVAATTYIAGPFAVSPAFGGVMPQKWGIMLRNKSGAALDSTGASHAVLYQGYNQTVS